MGKPGTLVVVLLLAATLALSAWGQGKEVDFDPDLPPCVVKVEPPDRTTEVDYHLTEIKVTFDRPMTIGRNYSWIMYNMLGLFPGYEGAPEPRWETDGRTCVLPVKLSPDTLYAVGANSFRHTGFKSLDGNVAVPYVWVFRTKK